MGNAKIWFTPTSDQGSRNIEINLGSGFTDRTGPSPVLFKSSAEAYDGSRVLTVTGGRNRYTFSLTWSSAAGRDGQQIRRKLYALVNHLARGGSCMVAENSTYAWAAFTGHRPSQNATVIHPGRNLFEPLVSSVDVTGRELVLQSDHDSYVTEMGLVQTFSPSSPATMTLANGLVLGFHSVDWVLVREYGSYPALRLPDDVDPASILHTNAENSWSLELPLEDDPSLLDYLSATEPDAAGSTGIDPSPYDPSGSQNPNRPGGSSPSPGGWQLP